MNNTTKIRIVLVVATAIHLFLLGYLLWIKIARMSAFEWQIFVFDFSTIIVTEGTAFVTVAFSFAIFVFPFIIYETGFLDNDPDEPPDPDVEGGQTVEEAEEAFDRFVENVNRRIDYVNRHALPIGSILIIIGFSIIGVANVYLQGEGAYWHEWQKEITRNYRFLALPLGLIALSSLIIGLALIGLYIHRHLYSAGKEK